MTTKLVDETDKTITVGAGEIEWMQSFWQKRWNPPPRPQELDGLIQQSQLPESLELLGSQTVQDMPGARIEHATYKNNQGSLTEQTIVIDGLSALQTDVLLLVQLRDGTQHSAILRPSSPTS